MPSLFSSLSLYGLAVDHGGNWHILYNVSDWTEAGRWLDLKYINSTGTSETIVHITPTDEIEDFKRPRIAVDAGGNIHVAYILEPSVGSTEPERILYTRRSSGFWSAAEEIASESELGLCGLVVDHTGNWHILCVVSDWTEDWVNLKYINSTGTSETVVRVTAAGEVGTVG